MLIVDDHLLLRVLVGAAPKPLRRVRLATTTSWWWRLVSPLSRPRLTAGRHSRFVAGLSEAAASAVWLALQDVGQPRSKIHMPELVPLGPAMVWLARHEGLNRLAAEAAAAALDLSAAICVSPGNAGVLGDVADRIGVDLEVVSVP